MSEGFTRHTLSFLRALKRHNDREWFRAHKAEYDEHVRAPMLATIERLAHDFRSFAPDLAATPHSMFRIYRDTRFSSDKRPLKTHVAASFTSRRLPRGAGAGLYFHLDPNTDREAWIGGGIYAPEPRELARIRAHIAVHHRRLHRLVNDPAFRRGVGALEGAQLTRTPRGYAADHPAAAYLKFRQLYAGRSCDLDVVTSPRFHQELLRTFRLLAPLVAFLNAPLAGAFPEPALDPIAALLRRSAARRVNE